MENTRQKAMQIIQSQPENADRDDVAYEFCAQAKIAAGIRAADAGKIAPHDQVVLKFRARAKQTHSS